MVTQSQPTTGLSRFGVPVNDLSMVLVVLIWGLNFSVTKLSLNQFSPLAFAALRFTAGALLLWLILQWLEKPALPSRATMWKLIWVGVVGNTVYQICFMYGLKLTTAANSSLIIATVPALVALSGALLKIEKLTRTIIFGVLLATGGVALVVMERGVSLSPDYIIGDLVLLGCAISWTIYTLGVRTLSGSMSPLAITTWTMITGVPGLLLLALPDLLTTNWGAVTVEGWGGLMYAALLALVLGYILWNTSVRAVGSNRTAIYGFAIPLIATLAAWALLGEQPTWVQAAGGVLIVSGVLLTRR